MTSDAYYQAPRLSPADISWAVVANWGLQLAAVVGWVAQLFVDRSDANLVSGLLILVSSTITIQYLRLTQAFQSVPLSSFALLGLCLTTQWGALVFQSAAWTAVSQNLRDPVRTFGLLGVYQCAAVLAHLIFSHLRATMSLRRLLANRLLAPLGVFQIPSANALWLIGAVGTATSYVTNTGFEHDVGDKLLAGAAFFRVAPFLIPLLYWRYGSRYCEIRKHLAGLLLYLLITVGVGIATNARSLVFSGLMASGVSYFLFMLSDLRQARGRSILTLGALALAVLLSSNLMSSLATAMQVGRQYRDRSHSQWDVISETLDALRHPEKIDAYRQKADALSEFSPYDEKYLANQVLARIVETKFHDNMLAFSENIRDEDVREARDLVVDRLWAQLPAPVLKWLKIPVDKAKLQFSMGDFWVDLRYGKGVGRFAVGSMFADGGALFGAWFPMVYGLMCVCLFLVWECMSQPDHQGGVRVSIVALLLSVQIFQNGITAESISFLLAFPLRWFLQNLAFYLLAFWATRLIFRPFEPREYRPQRLPGSSAERLEFDRRLSAAGTA